ncbi:MAG TPA: helix-turn-helix transcriptional regulator [Thermoanaerobaculia bacterium]|nr:helix-turn-helix transcriptional regulator [Thermoanaerobaculia bacterium]
MFAEVGAALRFLRESVDLTQAELARRARVGKSQLSKYESGKELPKLESLGKLLAVLETEPLILFYTAHLLQHRERIVPVALLLATRPPGRDPALESFRKLFDQFLESFEVLVRSRLGATPSSTEEPPSPS